MAVAPSPELRSLRPLWAEVDLDALRSNVRLLAGLLRPPARLLAVVKADAYGHGAVEVARAALESGAWGLGVATVEEGVEVRRAGVTSPVLVLGPTLPEEAEDVVAHDLSAAVFRAEVARALSRAASRIGRPARVHLKVDTGMGRIGVLPEQAIPLAREVAGLPGVALEGCFTHFATADERDLGPTRAQLARFCEVLDELQRAGVRVGLRHAANSAASLALSESHLDLVRCGIALYGVPPAPHLSGLASLRPVMRLVARAVHVKRVPAGTPVGYGWTYRTSRETTIVTVPAGYADGYPRLAGEGGEVVVAGRRVPVAGRVSMDQLTIDVGDLPVQPGDPVELWGPALPVTEVAAWARTIAYEVLARVSRRVPRVFVEGGVVRAVRTLLGTREASAAEAGRS